MINDIPNLLECFIATPARHLGEVVTRLSEVIDYVDDKPELCKKLADLELDFSKVELTPEQQQVASEASSIEDRDMPEFAWMLRSAIEGQPARIRQFVDTLPIVSLHDGLEGISNLVRVTLREEDELRLALWTPQHVLLHPESEKELLTPRDFALEVARFSSLWDESDSELRPSTQAADLASWAHTVLGSVPRLLRHFSAEAVGHGIMLHRLPVVRWRDDVATRLAPSTDQADRTRTQRAPAARR